MDERTSLLFGLDEFEVVGVDRLESGLQVMIEMAAFEAGCPGCGVLSSRVKDRPRVRVKDLPACGQRTQVWWRKRRLTCSERACSVGSFTQTSMAIRPRARLSARLREGLARSIAGSNRSVAEVAREHGVAWHTAHGALIAAAAGWLPAPEPTTVLGIDETRARSVRWIRAEAGWHRSDPWMTSFVNADPRAPGRLLGLAPGRTGACVKGWLAAQTREFRAGIAVVVIDPSAPYASGIRAALPDALIAVDHFHLVQLANQMITEVRQRMAREQLGRRGRATDGPWAHRRMLLTAGDRLSARQLARLGRVLDADDPTEEIGAAWACKELLRLALQARDPWDIRDRMWRFHTACADADMPETTRLAATVDTWWPHILVFLQLRVTNARTEGFNRIIKQVKRAGCGFRNMDNYERRILAHIALTRAASPAA
jgi:transposase